LPEECADVACRRGTCLSDIAVLVGDRAGQHSIRVNRQWRVCFVWTANGPQDVEIVDYH
jgi:proteic killer suppression protein